MDVGRPASRVAARCSTGDHHPPADAPLRPPIPPNTTFLGCRARPDTPNTSLLVRLAGRGRELLIPALPARRSGIVTFRFRHGDAAFHAELYRRLMANGVICAHRGGGIRYSPHFYTQPDVIERALRTALTLAVDIT